MKMIKSIMMAVMITIVSVINVNAQEIMIYPNYIGLMNLSSKEVVWNKFSGITIELTDESVVLINRGKRYQYSIFYKIEKEGSLYLKAKNENGSQVEMKYRVDKGSKTLLIIEDGLVVSYKEKEGKHSVKPVFFE